MREALDGIAQLARMRCRQRKVAARLRVREDCINHRTQVSARAMAVVAERCRQRAGHNRETVAGHEPLDQRAGEEGRQVGVVEDDVQCGLYRRHAAARDGPPHEGGGAGFVGGRIDDERLAHRVGCRRAGRGEAKAGEHSGKLLHVLLGVSLDRHAVHAGLRRSVLVKLVKPDGEQLEQLAA